MPTTAKDVLEALKQVKYPGFRRDIVSFGIVRDIEHQRDRAIRLKSGERRHLLLTPHRADNDVAAPQRMPGDGTAESARDARHQPALRRQLSL